MPAHLCCWWCVYNLPSSSSSSAQFQSAPSQQFTIMRTFHSERQNRVFVQDRKKQDYQNDQDFQNYQRVFVKVRSRKQDSQTIPSGDSVCRCIVSNMWFDFKCRCELISSPRQYVDYARENMLTMRANRQKIYQQK